MCFGKWSSLWHSPWLGSFACKYETYFQNGNSKDIKTFTWNFTFSFFSVVDMPPVSFLHYGIWTKREVHKLDYKLFPFVLLLNIYLNVLPYMFCFSLENNISGFYISNVTMLVSGECVSRVTDVPEVILLLVFFSIALGGNRISHLSVNYCIM